MPNRLPGRHRDPLLLLGRHARSDLRPGATRPLPRSDLGPPGDRDVVGRRPARIADDRQELGPHRRPERRARDHRGDPGSRALRRARVERYRLRRPDRIVLPRPKAGDARPETSSTWEASPAPRRSWSPLSRWASSERPSSTHPGAQPPTLMRWDESRRPHGRDRRGRRALVTSGGRTSTTIYDADNHPTDKYGPAPTTCFNMSTRFRTARARARTRSRTRRSSTTTTSPACRPRCGRTQPGTAHRPVTAWRRTPPVPSTTRGPARPAGLTTVDNWSARFTGVYNPGSAPARTPSASSSARPTRRRCISTKPRWVPRAGLPAARPPSPERWRAPTPFDIRIDYKAGTGTSTLRLGITPPAGVETFTYGAAVKPGFFYGRVRPSTTPAPACPPPR